MSVLYRARPATAAIIPTLLFGGLLGCGSSVQSLVSAPAGLSTPPSAVKSGPQLGYIWSDQAHTLRPVLGVPGSTQLGQSVVPANLYTAAVASNLGSVALLQESDGSLDRMALPAGEPIRLSASAPGAHLRLSPSGVAAIAFVPGSNILVLVTGLLTTPHIATLTLSQPIAEAAVSDSGLVASALSSSGATAIRTVTSSGTATLAATVTTLGGLAFAGTGESLLVADAAANTLTLVQAGASTLVSTGGLLKSPLGVAASHDGRWAVLANSGDTNIVRIDLTGQTAPQRLACDCQPALVAPLSDAAVFRLTAADTGPTWIVDAAPATPRALFIPAIAAAAAKAGGN